MIDGGNSVFWNLKNVSSLTTENNFDRLNINPEGVKIEVFARKGNLLEEKKIYFLKK